MKRLSVTILMLALLSLTASAQNRRFVVRSFTPSDLGDMRARTAPVMDNNKKLTALIDISFAASEADVRFEGTVGEPVRFPGEWLVRVPEGASRIKISMEGCKPLEFTIPENVAIESAMVYLMDLDVEEAIKMRTLIMPSLSLGFSKPMDLSYGLMVGLCKRNGGFLRVKTDFSFGLKTVADCDAEGLIDGVKGWYTGEARKSRFAITGGYMRHLVETGENSSLYAYVGAGYGTRTVAWQMVGAGGEQQYARVAPSSFKGVEAELGLVYRLGGVVFSAGVQTNSFKYYEANLGVGVMF